MIGFFLASDIVVTGSNPEMADMDNPRGNIYGERWYIVAENNRGRRWRHFTMFANPANANRLRDKIENIYAKGERLDPKYWKEMDPAYGSTEYMRQNIEEMRASQERWEERFV